MDLNEFEQNLKDEIKSKKEKSQNFQALSKNRKFSGVESFSGYMHSD